MTENMEDDFRYYEAVNKVQALFANAPTPGEVVRAIERLGWAHESCIREKIAREFENMPTIDPAIAWANADAARFIRAADPK